MTIDIIEILRRSDQGVTEPFICRAEDGNVYFVKGKRAGNASLVKEWLAGKLALALGLPIAPFEMVNVPPELVRIDSEMNLLELGAGYAFGSQLQLASEINFANLSNIATKTRQDILVFDWWVKNQDRSLTQHGGNPNLLWRTESQSVVMIDHHNAFDYMDELQRFAADHIFGDEFFALCHDANLKAAYKKQLSNCLTNWNVVVDAIPSQWLFEDTQQSVPINFELDLALKMLNEHTEERFWKW